MPESPDFDQIAARLDRQFRTCIGSQESDQSPRLIADALRQIWHAGFDAGGQHETLIKHLKDENTAAHHALDRDAPKTRPVPTRDGTGKQEITIGLAERIDAARRHIWNSRGAVDLAKIEHELSWMMGATAAGPYCKNLDRALRALDR